MPAVPKPSQTVKKPSKKTIKASPPQAKTAATDKTNHYAELKAKALSNGGLSPQEVRDECDRRGLTKKTAGNYVCYLNKDGLVRKAATL